MRSEESIPAHQDTEASVHRVRATVRLRLQDYAAARRCLEMIVACALDYGGVIMRGTVRPDLQMPKQHQAIMGYMTMAHVFLSMPP
jgi:hypothetical protein